jgi:hypothetical protein
MVIYLSLCTEITLEMLLQQIFPHEAHKVATDLSTSKLSDPSVFCIAAKGVVMEMFAIEQQTFIAASALDLAVYETERSNMASPLPSSSSILHRSSMVHNISSRRSKESVSGSGSSPREGWVMVDGVSDEQSLNERQKGLAASYDSRTVYVDARALSCLLRESIHIQRVADPNLLACTLDDANTQHLHAVLLQALIIDAPSVISPNETSQEVRLHMDFQNITHHFDPNSNWINKVAVMMAPVRPDIVLERRRHIRAKALRALAVTQSAYLRAGADHMEIKGPVEVLPMDENDQRPIKLPFAVTSVSVNVSSCLFDYRCPEHSSRLMLSVGKLSVSTTIVSSYALFSLKVVAEDIDLYVSKFLNNRIELEENPLDVNGMFRPIRVVDTEKERIQSEFEFELKPASDSGTDGVISGIKSASEFLDVHQFVPLIALSKSSVLVTVNTHFGSRTRDPYILQNRGTLLVVDPGDSTGASESFIGGSAAEIDADDENISGFSANAVVMSMHGCTFEARMDSIDVLVVSFSFRINCICVY